LLRVLSPQARTFLEAARVAHLATASRAGEPHVIPVCFALVDEQTLVFAIDDKPKTAGRPLKRLRNLTENDRFALVVDRWSEDWGDLAYVLVSGRGALCTDRARLATAIDRLRGRYPQYVAMRLDAERHPVVELTIDRVHEWGRVAGGEG
jgi:PPOX class probable F420-dependent enzyme